MNFKPTTSIVKVGEFFVCNCGVPLVKCTGWGQYEILKKDRGQTIKLKVETTNGMIRVGCDVCGRGFAYINVQESIGVYDMVAVNKS